MTFKQFKEWHETAKGLIVFSLFGLVVAYFIGSRAIQTGSLQQYFLTLFFLTGGLRNLFKLVGNTVHGNKHKAKKA